MNTIASFSTLTPSVYLASQSPRRREILTQIGLPFEVLSVEVAEVRGAGEAAEDLVCRLAAAKASAGAVAMAERGLPRRPVLGADTVVVCDAEVLGKPQDLAAAKASLGMLSGRSHEVLSAVSLCDGERQLTRLGRTRVSFRPLSNAEICAYWDTGEPCDKAGGYGIQGLGSVFVEKIEGSYSNVVGLPIEELVLLLRAFELDYWQGATV